MKLTLAFLALSVACLSSAQNLIQNGSFEDGPFVDSYGYGYQFMDPFDTGLPHWLITHYQVLRGKNGVTYDGLSSSDGQLFMDLTGSQNNDLGILQQTVATAPGQMYRLSVDLGLNPTSDPFGFANGPISLQVGFGSDTAILTFAPTTNGMQWKTFTADFTASSSFSTVVLAGLSKPTTNAFFGVDNVKVEAVPEPMTLLALGLGAAGVVRRRTRPAKG